MPAPGRSTPSRDLQGGTSSDDPFTRGRQTGTTMQNRTYIPRVVDRELDTLLSQLPAISLEGARAVGKTRTASRRAGTTYELDDPGQRQIVKADPELIREGKPPILVDEWQRVPATWDVVRRAVDAGGAPGSYLLTGSATPSDRPTHSGAGRIVSVRMRPLSLSERSEAPPSVSLGDLLSGQRPAISGRTDRTLTDYVDAILQSGFPGLQSYDGDPLRRQLDGYLRRIVDTDFEQMGRSVRNREALRRWMSAYAAATATTASYEKIRDAATPGEGDKPAKTTTRPYRETLEQLWIIDPVPAWQPSRNYFSELGSAPKHHLADPALAARLLGVGKGALLQADDPGPSLPRDGTLLGHLFESLVTLSVRGCTNALDARVRHLRTWRGRHEVDLIVERADGRILAIEVKLSNTVDREDVGDLHWLAEELDDELLDAVVVTTGPGAYRREDGIAVVPAALLGP